jgi:hypothetical protein
MLMAVFSSSFFYALDENGASQTGRFDSQIANGAANSTESIDNSIVEVGETFDVVFTDPVTNATFGGTYTYIGHDPAFSGFIAQDSSGEFFYFSNDGTIPDGTILNGFVAEDIPVCFLAGTMIACPDGERAVETLAIGDLVLTSDSRAVPVRWVGRQTLSTFFGMPEGRRPVCIAAGALGDNLPVDDLRLTTDHALLIDDVLVQAGALVNGSTIRRIPPSDLGERFVVYHVETENHEVILAEGAPAETFVDNISRRHFDNYAEFAALYGDQAPIVELDQPRAMSARQVPRAIRERLAAIAQELNRVEEAAA